MDSLPITVRTTLLGAANLIRQRGWAKFTMQDYEGRLCVRGAIRRYLAETLPADTDPVIWETVTERAEQWVNNYVVRHKGAFVDGTRFSPTAGVVLAPWNDLVCQSQDEAAGVLEAAAQVL